MRMSSSRLVHLSSHCSPVAEVDEHQRLFVEPQLQTIGARLTGLPIRLGSELLECGRALGGSPVRRQSAG